MRVWIDLKNPLHMSSFRPKVEETRRLTGDVHSAYVSRERCDGEPRE